MRPGVPYAGNELAFYEEAMRTVPAIALMRSQGRKGDTLGVIQALHNNGADLKVEPMRRWAIITSAYMAWCQQLFEGAAQHENESVEDLLHRAIARATAWAAESA